MAITAMDHGVYPGVEVGPASTVEECRALVDARRETGVPCMLLENACYGRDMMAVLRMVREGLFGELVHCRCGYLHDIRSRLVTGQARSLDVVDGIDFRTLHSLKRNGDVYPTHGIGPVAKYLGVNRGNRFVSLTATASKSAGLPAWAEANLDADHPAHDHEWAIGDVITTTITCANGETVVVTHDCSLPRPKERNLHVQGTRGLWRDDGGQVYVDGRSPDHEWESIEAYRPEYEHPLWERFEEVGVRGGHGGMDYPTLREYVTAVRHGAPPPIDVFDAATWMAIAPLTERSIARGSEPVAVPDFTNGAWMRRRPTFGFDEPRDGRPPVTEIFADASR
jgi:predicted dehydrogenase